VTRPTSAQLRGALAEVERLRSALLLAEAELLALRDARSWLVLRQHHEERCTLCSRRMLRGQAIKPVPGSDHRWAHVECPDGEADDA
jgi:hypothetical protein